MSGINLKPGYLFAVIALMLSWLSGSDGIACLDCSHGAADLLFCTSIVECNHDEACYVDMVQTTQGGTHQFSAGCRKVSKCANPNATSADVMCSQCCYSDVCNFQGCGSEFYGDPNKVLKCFACADIAAGDMCPQITQCDKTLEMCVNKHGATGRALGCMKTTMCNFLNNLYSHQPPEFRDVHCCGSNFCNWDTWDLNRTVVHPVDGVWSTWSSWSQCDVTCGSGHETRQRTCSNPAPAHGGHTCPGVATETHNCTRPQCPVDGDWDIWTSWSPCDVTCGNGQMTRTRACSNPPPAHGGKPCSGQHSDTKTCTERACPINGNWSNWSHWSQCDVTCGSGHVTRTRTCTNPAPAYGGLYCVGDNNQTNTCTEKPCPVDGNWTHWSSWSQCDVTCGGGHITHTRICTNPAPAHGGLTCLGPNNETSTCTKPQCPVDGNWTLWSPWSKCDVTCGSGHVTRTRTCTNPAPAYGGHVCSGENNQTNTCTEKPCPVDGNWTHWSSWSQCDVTCGSGHMTRTRDCTNPAPAFGGLTCQGQHNETSTCTKPDCPVDGQWTNWNSWLSCDVTCGSGHVTRTRTCTNPPPAHGGNSCNGNSSERSACTGNACPVNGGWTEWSAWSGCDVTCGAGRVTRDRKCTNPVPQYGGSICSGADNETKTCTLSHCPIDGGWTLWSAWSGCDVTCGAGHVTRGRNCANRVPQYGGRLCSGEGNETNTCTLSHCPVDGGWTLWTAWSGCDVTCGAGHLTRDRNCTNPVPQYGGSICSGVENETKTCTLPNCPIDGGWTLWTAWSGCDVTCGTGHETRERNCTNPAPKFGGTNCNGTDNETKICTLLHCPVDGVWTEWSAWSSCDVTCGAGHVTRDRNCTNPAPNYGGSICSGADNETKTCTVSPCPVHGGWSDWGSWSSCDVTCASGHVHRSRTCTNPAPQYGGHNCVGSATDTNNCNLVACPNIEATLRCDFTNQTLCHWSNVLITDNFDWSTQPADPALNLTDHTSGRGSFLMLNKTSAIPSGARAVLKSAELPPSDGDCLQFWYIADGNDVGEISVYIQTDYNTSRVWSLANGHVTGWNQGNATLKSNNKFHVLLEGVIGAGPSGYLALDDVTLVTGECVIPAHHSHAAALIG